MASLGQVCALGIGCNMLIAIFVLPVWWSALSRHNRSDSASTLPSPSNPPLQQSTTPTTPSYFYGVFAWRLGLTLVRFVPRRLLQSLLIQLALLYWRLAGHRREILINNLLPAVNGDRAVAIAKAKSLMRNFAIKLVDLWRYEAGLPIDDLFGPSDGWERLEKLRAEKRGVLILTCHVGNWELGAPWLAKKDILLQVVTLAEPSEAFTKLRQASRAKWKIETLVIGSDPFAVVDVIRRLENGAMIALLVDRPPPGSGINAELFGKPFTAAIAAAELARASGCAILPVYLPRGEHNYSAHLLPEIPYERAALRDRAARQQLTQKIMQVFEPVICSHIDQWYHFVPVWPATQADKAQLPQ
jgi:lauroyl/myristoyl acyltransferase